MASVSVGRIVVTADFCNGDFGSLGFTLYISDQRNSVGTWAADWAGEGVERVTSDGSIWADDAKGPNMLREVGVNKCGVCENRSQRDYTVFSPPNI